MKSVCDDGKFFNLELHSSLKTSKHNEPSNEIRMREILLMKSCVFTREERVEMLASRDVRLKNPKFVFGEFHNLLLLPIVR